MGKKLLQFRVWGGKIDYKYPMMIWSEDADIAFYRIARGIEPSVSAIEWTGEYIDPDKVLEALKKEGEENDRH